MVFTTASPASLFAFAALLILILAALFFGTHFAAPKQTSKTIVLVTIWLGISTFVVESGILRSHPMPLVPLFFLLMNAAAVVFSFSPLGRNLAIGLPLQALVGFQGFRLFLELILHSWAEQGTIPTTMTWNGQNFDIVSGIAALVLATFAARWKVAAWVANLLGIVLLLNVIRVVVLSSPLPFAWKVDPPLQLIFYFPYFLIVPVCIGGALAGHILLTRALLLKQNTSASG